MRPLSRREPPPVLRGERPAPPPPSEAVPRPVLPLAAPELPEPASRETVGTALLREITRPGVLRLREALPQAAAPRDPAPSRLRYRLQRLWLTPVWRVSIRLGLPLALVAAIGAAYFGDDARRAALAGTVADIRQSIEERPEFMVGVLRIDGASRDLDGAIRAALPVALPESSFRLDLEAMRQTVTAFDAVAAAEVRVQPGGILHVSVVERVPAILWRGPDGLVMLDATGHRVAALDSRLARPDLGIIAGEGADRAVPEALRLLVAAQPVKGRLRGLVRMGERRWDVVLDRGQRILLPEQGAVAALERAMALALAEDMLDRDVTVIDLRNGHRPTLRLSDPAMEDLRRMRDLAQTVRNG